MYLLSTLFLVKTLFLLSTYFADSYHEEEDAQAIMSNQMDRPRPKAYHHGDLRNALIQAGLEILAEGGAAELDLRKVARKAGVSHAAPYRHFTDKQALVA